MTIMEKIGAVCAALAACWLLRVGWAAWRLQRDEEGV